MLSGIRELRLKRGLTQRDVEKMTGIHQPKISYIERGLPCTAREKKALARAFGLKNQQDE